MCPYCRQTHTNSAVAYCGVCQAFKCSARVYVGSRPALYRCNDCGLPLPYPESERLQKVQPSANGAA